MFLLSSFLSTAASIFRFKLTLINRKLVKTETAIVNYALFPTVLNFNI